MATARLRNTALMAMNLPPSYCGSTKFEVTPAGGLPAGRMAVDAMKKQLYCYLNQVEST